MTLLEDPPSTVAEETVEEAGGAQAASGGALVCASAALVSAAAGWMAGGVFAGGAARVLAVVAAVIGAATVGGSLRLRRPAIVQYLTLPGAALLGAIVILPSTANGSSLPGLVGEALRGGGLAQPPVPFDPGWRFVLVVTMTLLGSASAALAIGMQRPKLAVILPLPVVLAAGLAQPQGAETVSTLGAVFLGVLGLAVSFGDELSRDGASSGAFEVRRLARGLGAAVGLLVAVGVLAQLGGALLPEPADDQVIPPKRPEVPPPAPDRPLFRVKRTLPATWRLGVLDVYDDDAWKTPPFDPARFQPVSSRTVPADADIATHAADNATHAAGTETITFEISGLAGRVLPVPPGLMALQGTAAEIDPRTGVVRRPSGRVSPGLSYTVTARPAPSAGELLAAPSPPDSVSAFLAAPPMPPDVEELLAGAPADPGFARLQFARRVFYERVVAAGAGRPVDMPPSRVVELLAGQEATPYEITAAEALLARWSGVPARIGFGYFGGEAQADGLEVRPRNGATWLEVYFEGPGWVPLVGVPPRAKGSLDDEAKKSDPAVRPTDELALVTYVPIRRDNLRQFSTVARFWAGRIVAVGLLVSAALALVPSLLRGVRRRRRGRWARGLGPGAHVAVAYAELRDGATDLGIGAGAATPLEFAAAVAPDGEHHELAWLVTRAQWGDLAGQVGPEDADAGEALARSVLRRLRLAQPGLTRAAAMLNRASLRRPYAGELPGIDSPPSRELSVGALTMAVLLAGIVAATTMSAPDRETPRPAALPAVPTESGGVRLQREPVAEAGFRRAGNAALVRDGAVYSIRRGSTVEGSLQTAALRTSVLDRRDDVREGVLQDIGSGRFRPIRLGGQRAFALTLPEQRLLLWFAPDGGTYQLLVARRAFEDADAVFASILASQRGEATIVGGDDIPPPDPRRGGPA